MSLIPKWCLSKHIIEHIIEYVDDLKTYIIMCKIFKDKINENLITIYCIDNFSNTKLYNNHEFLHSFITDYIYYSFPSKKEYLKLNPRYKSCCKGCYDCSGWLEHAFFDDRKIKAKIDKNLSPLIEGRAIVETLFKFKIIPNFAKINCCVFCSLTNNEIIVKVPNQILLENIKDVLKSIIYWYVRDILMCKVCGNTDHIPYSEDCILESKEIFDRLAMEEKERQIRYQKEFEERRIQERKAYAEIAIQKKLLKESRKLQESKNQILCIECKKQNPNKSCKNTKCGVCCNCQAHKNRNKQSTNYYHYHYHYH